MALTCRSIQTLSWRRNSHGASSPAGAPPMICVNCRRTRSVSPSAESGRERHRPALVHEWAQGTLSLSLEGMTRPIPDLGRETARSLPARNLAVINGHGGNRGILEALAQDLRADFKLNVCILHPTTWADLHAAAKTPEIHGGKNETSMMLATAPHLVRVDEIKKLQAASGADAVRATILDQSVTWPWTTNEKAIADMGIIGDAKSASTEFGKQLLEKITDAAVGVFKQLLERQQLLRG